MEDLLPHKKPMLLLDEIIAYSETTVHAQLNIKESIPFYTTLGVPSYIALEYMAQAVAAWNGVHARLKNEEPKIGFLLGTRKLDLKIPYFELGDCLDIYGLEKYNDGEMAVFECYVTIREKIVVTALLNVFQPENIKNFT